MDKLITFPGKTDAGIFTYVIDAEKSFLEKTAAEYHPTIADYINNAKTIPGKTQILLTALGAGEFFGSNRNGDYFPEAALAHEGRDYGFKTFEYNAKVFRNHLNTPKDRAYGSVALSIYNPKYHRVELIVHVDNASAPDIVSRIENGDYPDVSMGSRVPFDYCNICGNKAKTRKDYCECLRYYMGRMHPSGRIAYAVNDYPNFHDISFVLIGADKIAKALKKVATVVGTTKSAAEEKEATIEKEIPANEPPASQQSLDTLVKSIPEVKAQEKPMPREVLNQLGESPLPKVMSTLAMLGILPKPQEFQRIVLVSMGRKNVADQLDDRGLCFDPMSVQDSLPIHEKILRLSGDEFDPGIMNLMSPHMADRSYAAPHLGRRLVIMIKRAQEETVPTFLKLSADDERKPVGIVPLLMLAAGLYAAFGKKAPPEMAGKLDKVIAKHPGLAAVLGLGALTTFNSMFGTKAKGQYTDAVGPINPDANDVFARIEEQKQKPYLKVAALMGPFSKRLFLGVPLAYMASGVLQKHRELNPYDEEGRVRSFVRKNPDIVSGALIADAMLSLQGKGTHGMGKKLKSLVPSHLAKAASAQDFLANSLIWPLAMGRANLPGRVVGGLFDQAVLESSKKLLEQSRNRKQGKG